MELSNSPLVTNIIRTIQPTTDLTGYLVPGRYRIRVRAGNRGGLSDWSYPVMFSAIDQSTSASDQSTSASDQSTSASGNIVLYFMYHTIQKFCRGKILAK